MNEDTMKAAGWGTYYYSKWISHLSSVSFGYLINGIVLCIFHIIYPFFNVERRINGKKGSRKNDNKGVVLKQL